MRSSGRSIAASSLFLCLGLALRLAGGAATAISGRSCLRTPAPAGIAFTCEWTDAAGVRREIDWLIPGAELEASEQAVGFSTEELEAYLIEAEAQIRREQGLSAVDIASQVVSSSAGAQRFQVGKDPTSDFKFVLRTDPAGGPANQAEIDRVLAVYHQRWASSQKAIHKRLQERLKAFVEARGMELTAGGIAADYRNLVRSNAARLKPLADAFRRTCGRDRVVLLEAVHSFVQSIPYRRTPPVVGGRYTAGLTVPLRVLAEDGGDCDSKAVLFAAIWRNLSNYRTILISVPQHMLVGVAVPFGEGASVTIQSIRYLLLEMSCAEKVRPGALTQYSADAIGGQDYKYLIVN